MEKKDALVLVFSRNSFYKGLHYLALSAFALSLFAIGLLVWALVFLIENPTHPLYFATDDVGRLVQVVPVNVPNMSTEDVTQWTIDAAEAAFSYDYINYRSQLQSAQKYFTNYGWTKYMDAIKSSNNLVGITQRKMIALAQVVDQPKILAQGILAGAYAWKFEMPMLVTYLLPPYDAKSTFSNPLVVTMIVQRQPVLEGYKGLGVVQIIGAIATTPATQPQEISGTPTG